MKNHNQIKMDVTLALIQDAKTRDCDILLYSEILRKQGKLFISAGDLMDQIKRGNIPSYDSVSRIRRMVQMQNENLRGKEWAKRHIEKQNKAKKDLGYAVNLK